MNTSSSLGFILAVDITIILFKTLLCIGYCRKGVVTNGPIGPPSQMKIPTISQNYIFFFLIVAYQR